MKRKIIVGAGVISILAVLIGAAFLAWRWLPSLPQDLRTALITVVVSTVTVFVAKSVEHGKVVSQEQRREKWPVYEEFVEYLFAYMLSEKTGKPKPTQNEFADYMGKFGGKILLLASPEVIRTYNDFRLHAVNSHSGGPQAARALLMKVERFLLALRSEFGHDNSGLKKGDVLKIFVNDIGDKLADYR